MHELGVAHDILKTVLEQARAYPGRRVLRVSVRTGELAMLVPDSLAFAFGAIARGTPAEGAVLEVAETPLRSLCRDCGGEAEGIAPRCPACGGRSLEMRGGHEVVLASMEIED